MKDIGKFFNKEHLTTYLMIFYILSIVLDLHIFYNSISTLIRVIFISIIFLIIFFRDASKKEKKLILSYFLLLTIYLILHIIHVKSFNITIDTEYNTFSELLYFLKVSMNILIIFIVYKLNIKKDNFYKLISISAFLISFSIIISNIFKIGYTSYDFTKINYNLFDWFNIKNIDFYTASTKGFFHLTNQISAILVLYLTILLIKLRENIKFINIVNILLVIISLFMLGTRVSTYSNFIVLSVTLIINISVFIVEKKVNYKYTILLFLLAMLSYGIYNSSPILSRNMYYNRLFNPEVKETEILETVKSEGVENISDEDFKLYLKNFNIVPDFYNIHYPLEKDRDFYENYINMGTTKINDTRFLELNIIKRIKSLNNNKWDSYFGIGYDRVINIFNIESDYVMQYYAIGIIGVILVLGVNIILVIYSYFKMLFNLKRYFNFENLMLLFSVTYFLACSYFTGNILNSISCIIPISFVLGYFIRLLKNYDKKDEYEYYLGFKTTLKTKEEVVSEIFKEKKQVILFNINPLICLNFRNNKKLKKEFNSQKYNIPDGNGIVLSSKLTSNFIEKSTPGIEVMESICENSIKNKYSIYLYGAKEDSVKKSKDNLEKKYKNINIVGYVNGYRNESDVIKDINKSKPDILFVALGTPKQEEFIINNKEKLKNIKIIMPVGGSFDVISGNLKRAPLIFRKLKLEWLYRMLKEPKRFVQVFKLIYFILLVLFRNFWYNE